jgi:pSer/pThr/pTyr-binding forkhead associated (FHA) protein
VRAGLPELQGLSDRAPALGPFVVMRGGGLVERIVELEGARRVPVGRSPASGIVIEGDPRVSWLHAELTCVAGEWAISDDGLSRNGTFVNELRVRGRRRLADGDVIRVGRTRLLFRRPGQSSSETTAGESVQPIKITPAQRRVLVALCRPYRDGRVHAVPPTNRQIAGELVVSLDVVKSHLRDLAGAFGIAELPQNAKRARLARLALELGVVQGGEL